MSSPSAPEQLTLPVPPTATEAATLALSANVESLPIAVTIPGHEILGELGRGGMGVVYKARQTNLNRLVAVKVVLAGGHASGDGLARFLAEAEAVARMQHPNIVQIFERGQQDGLPYFTLEYVDGGSLAQKLNGTPLPPREAAQLIEVLARGVQYAHANGVVHRDLKPANVLLARDGTPKIADFGLAKRTEDRGDLTKSGALMGTPSYMAPEQADSRGKQVGPAADVYALGAILYECLTGRPPFKAATLMDTIWQVVRDEPVAPSQLQSRTPRDLETICLKCLQKEAAQRYGSARTLADDLQRFLNGEPIVARPVGPIERAVKWARRRPAAALLLAVGILMAVVLPSGGVALLFSRAAQQETELALRKVEEARNREEEARKGEAEQRRRAEGALRETQRNLARFVHNLAFSSDGQRLAIANPDNSIGVWELQTGQEILRLKGHTNPVQGVAFSLDGQKLLSGSGDKTLRLWDVRTGETLVVFQGHTATVNGVAFSPDGTRVGSASLDGTVRIWDARGGQQLFSLKGHTNMVYSVAFSPDGTRLATGSEDRTVKMWDARTGESLLDLKGFALPIMDLTFSDDGTRLIATESNRQTTIWDARTGRQLKAVEQK